LLPLRILNATERELHDFLREVNTMKCIAGIAETDLPVRAGFRVERKADPDYGMSEDEIRDRDEFIRCYLFREFELLMLIPAPETCDDFFIGDYVPQDAEYSAFNTADFQNTLRPFNKYAYAMKKIMERVKHMAIMHSCIECPYRRQEVYARYESLVDFEFRDRLTVLVNRYKYTDDEERRAAIKDKIGELNRRIVECRKIWGSYAPPEVWDL
jgi:hypothetical protein